MFDQNFAMQSMMMHETVRQQNENMRQLRNMLERENRLMLQQQRMIQLRQQQAENERLLRQIYEAY